MSHSSALSKSNGVSIFLARLARVAASAGGSDRLFMMVQYGLTLILPSIQPPTTLAPRSSRHPAHSRIKLFMALKKLRDMASDYRIFARLVGYPAIHTWGISTFNTTRPADAPVPGWIEELQVLANLAYQPIENVAYLSSHDILPLSKTIETKLWLWCCRCWAAHVFLDLYRLHLVRREYMTSSGIGEKSSEERDTLSFNWVRDVVINLAYAPLTLHWSLPKGLPGMTERAVGACGVVAALGQLSKAWEAAK